MRFRDVQFAPLGALAGVHVFAMDEVVGVSPEEIERERCECSERVVVSACRPFNFDESSAVDGNEDYDVAGRPRRLPYNLSEVVVRTIEHG